MNRIYLLGVTAILTIVANQVSALLPSVAMRSIQQTMKMIQRKRNHPFRSARIDIIALDKCICVSATHRQNAWKMMVADEGPESVSSYLRNACGLTVHNRQTIRHHYIDKSECVRFQHTDTHCPTNETIQISNKSLISYLVHRLAGCQMVITEPSIYEIDGQTRPFEWNDTNEPTQRVNPHKNG